MPTIKTLCNLYVHGEPRLSNRPAMPISENITNKVIGNCAILLTGLFVFKYSLPADEKKNKYRQRYFPGGMWIRIILSTAMQVSLMFTRRSLDS